MLKTRSFHRLNNNKIGTLCLLVPVCLFIIMPSTTSQAGWYDDYGPSPGTGDVVQIGSMYVASYKDGVGCASNGKKSWQAALDWADGLNWCNQTDWRMPTKDQLAFICTNKGSLGSYWGDPYWSFTESDASNAWRVHLWDCTEFSQLKTLSFYVRAVRGVPSTPTGPPTPTDTPTQTPTPTPTGTPLGTAITNCTELQDIKNNLAENYYLANDIDCSFTSSWNGGAGFEPIGTSSTLFTGTLDGQGYKITNLYIDRGDYVDYGGLFGQISGATISNVGLENVDITGGRSNFGALVGYDAGSSTITNCYSTGNMNGSGNNVGGLLGKSDGGSTIKECYSTGKVTISGSYIDVTGGLIGYGNNLTIENCYATGDVDGSRGNVGGLLGYDVGNSTIKECYSTGNVSSSGNNVGGLLGKSDGGSTIK